MVAYSFKPRFVPAIQVGLGHRTDLMICPKRQTIRAERNGRARHVRPTEIMHLYCMQRAVDGFKIGEAVCIMATPIILKFGRDTNSVDYVESPATGLVATCAGLNEFAQRDGFRDWSDMRKFWAEEHPGVEQFTGVLLMWEPPHDETCYCITCSTTKRNARP